MLFVRARSPSIRSGRKKRRGLVELDRGPERPSTAQRHPRRFPAVCGAR